MRFEARDLKPYAEPVPDEDLVVGTTYVSVSFLDPDMLVPELRPVVFIGRDLDEHARGNCFQDYESYRAGVRFDSAESEGQLEPGTAARFDCGNFDVCDYEHALDDLLRCSIRRRGIRESD
jgi:hypothetical protein